jgi:pilus assembly protein Flp/PilA
MLNLTRSATRRDETGAASFEYGLLIAGIAALVVLIVFAFGGMVKTVFDKTSRTVAKRRQRLASTFA